MVTVGAERQSDQRHFTTTEPAPTSSACLSLSSNVVRFLWYYHHQLLLEVPQGSILGPCLFFVFINDLTDRVASIIRLFADDTIVYRLVASEDTTGPTDSTPAAPDLRQFSFFPRTVKDWNALPWQETVHAPSLDTLMARVSILR